MSDLYSVLGLSHRASSEEVKAAYWTLAKRSHPDVNAGDKEAEQRTKEINRAYETLGDPEARAAYDLELARRRTKARRSFWSAAATGAATFMLTVATGAATFMLTVGSVSVTVIWRQHAELHQSPSGEPTLLARNEDLVVKPPAEDRANLGSAGLADLDTGDVPNKPVSAPIPEAFGEPPTSANSEIASAPLRDWDAKTRDEPAAPSSSTLERTPKEEVPGAPSSELTGTVQLPEGQPVPPVPARDAPPRTELANAASPEVGVKQPLPAAMVDQRSSDEPTPRDADRKTAAVGRSHKKPGKQFDMAETARATIPRNLQGSEREPRLISSSATALRWPSADEPYVNVGVRNR
jgi:curved DNA-binding protein CbpA